MKKNIKKSAFFLISVISLIILYPFNIYALNNQTSYVNINDIDVISELIKAYEHFRTKNLKRKVGEKMGLFKDSLNTDLKYSFLKK